jgi:glutamyl-tRNA synthetase
MSVRVRFAPSPTGKLHIGSARTALFNFLFARHERGKFLLRIEDTDQKRSTQESLDQILESLRWLGIQWDDEPVFQSRRLDRYRERARELMASGRAYEQADEQKGTAVAFRPDRGSIAWPDAVHGPSARDTTEDKDLVLLKSDGWPTYNFACVVDDIDMGITHVIRGNDHIPNTPKQISLYRALGAEPPVFAHIPLILNEDGSKMSKDFKKRDRGGAVTLEPADIDHFRRLGFLRQTLVNALALLGWSPGEDLELMSMETIIEKFTLDRVKTSQARFDLVKMTAFNGHYIRRTPLDELVELVRPYVPPHPRLRDIVAQQHERLTTLAEIRELTAWAFGEAVAIDEKARRAVLQKEGVKEHLAAAARALEGCDWTTAPPLEEALKRTAADRAVGLKHVAQPVRVAVTGSTASPPIHETLWLLGRERALARIRAALESLS